MNWRRFLGLEKRQAAPYTDAIVSALQDRATGVAASSDGLGALEIAAGLWAAWFGKCNDLPGVSGHFGSVPGCHGLK